MGCSPFGKLMSMAFGGRGKRHRKTSGRQERRRVRSPPPLPEHVTSHSMARTVIYRDDSPIVVAPPVHTIKTPGPAHVPDNNQQAQYHHHHHPPVPEAADILPSNHARAAFEREGGPEEAEYGVRADTCYQTQLQEQQASAGVVGTVYRYAPSPVPSAPWGEHQREYFGGEYRYCYPTPMREGIYNIATDANRLTSMFSDENPNACSIV